MKLISPATVRRYKMCALSFFICSVLIVTSAITVGYFFNTSTPWSTVSPWLKVGSVGAILGAVSHHILSMLCTAKINFIRTLALLCMSLSLGTSGMGLWFSNWILFWFCLAAIFVTLSISLYSFIGTISLSAPKVDCPACGKITKMLGRRDRCLYCTAQLSLSHPPAEAAQDLATPSTKSSP